MRGSVVKRELKPRKGTKKPVTVYYAVIADGDKRKWHGDPDTGSGFLRRDAAEAHLQDLLVSIRTGTYLEPSAMTLGEWSALWLATSKDRLKPSTWASYEKNLRVHVLPTLGDVPLQRLRATHLDALYAQLRASGKKVKNKDPQPLSQRTVKYVHIIVGACLKEAMRKGLIARNPQEQATAPRVIANADGSHGFTTWTAPDLAAFLRSSADHRHACLWAFLAFTGCRRGEALGLRWQDVDLERGRASIQQTVGKVAGQVVIGSTKTGAGRRPVALDPALVQRLREHQGAQEREKHLIGSGYHDQGLVFASPDGTPIYPEGVSRMFQDAAKAAGVPVIRLHDLRHSWATLALQSGVHPKVVQERLGHASITITLNTYSHVIPSMHEDAAQVVAAMIHAADSPNVVPLREAR